MYCANCGSELDADASFCMNCGHKVMQPVSATSMDSEPVQNASYETSSFDEDVRYFVGEKYPFYESKWKRMKEKGNTTSLNFPAFFLSIFWLGYRKMYREVAILALIFLAFDFILYLVGYQYTAQSLWDPVDRSINMGVAVMMGLFGNYFYQKHTLKKVSLIRNQGLTEEVKQMELKKRGEASFLGVLLSVLISVVIYILPASFIPMNVDQVELIKYGTFEQYPDKTVGETFDDFFARGDWQEVTNDSKSIVVAYHGEKQIDNHNYDIRIEFYKEKDSEAFDIQRIVVDDEALSLSETTSFLEYVFSNGQLHGDDSFDGGGPSDSYMW